MWCAKLQSEGRYCFIQVYGLPFVKDFDYCSFVFDYAVSINLKILFMNYSYRIRIKIVKFILVFLLDMEFKTQFHY